jgi:hypothetical protein
MKKYRLTLILTLIISLNCAGIAPTFSAIKPKSAGRTTTTIPNTILNGKGAPTALLGINGDFYIDTRSLSLYGPKKNGKWPSAQSLQGATGAAGASGADGKNGSDGRTTTNASNTAGPSGPQGDKGEKGDAGPAGSPGPAGASGTPGAKGDTGSSGAGSPGAKGDTGNTGATGAAGAAGLKGETGTAGATGAVGATGLKGETGTAGATGAVGETGPSWTAIGTMTYSDLQGGVGTSQSSTITGFKSGKSYIVQVKLICFQPSDSFDNSIPLGLTVSALGGTPEIATQYSVSKSHSYRNGAGSTRIEYSIDADLVINGSSSVDFSVGVLVIAGKSTLTSQLLRVQGYYTATLVGAVASL